MNKIVYEGHELEYFDDAYNFRKYQIQLIKKYLQKNLAEVGPGKGGLVGYYKKFVKKISLIEGDRNLYQLLKKNEITFSIMVYPHQASILYDKRNSRYYYLWKNYCENKCEYFIDAYTGFFDEANGSSKEDVISKYFIPLDSHYNHAGNIRLAEYINKYIDK